MAGSVTENVAILSFASERMQSAERAHKSQLRSGRLSDRPTPDHAFIVGRRCHDVGPGVCHHVWTTVTAS